MRDSSQDKRYFEGFERLFAALRKTSPRGAVHRFEISESQDEPSTGSDVADEAGDDILDRWRPESQEEMIAQLTSDIPRD